MDIGANNMVMVDIGASNTRYTSTGKIGLVPNNMVMMDKDTVLDIMPDNPGILNALEVVITKKGDSEFFPVKVLIGRMADRFSGANERPNALKQKHEQRINHISIITAVALSKLEHNLDDNLKVYLALPPAEVSRFKDKVKSLLAGTYTVTFPKYNGGVSTTFTIADVACHEESFMAMLSWFFNLDGTVNAEHKEYLVGNVLSLDIGASTTDLAIIKNGSYLDKSGKTYRIGGNIALDNLIDYVRGIYNYEMPVETAERVMAEGRLQLGKNKIVVTELVDQAKKEFASRIIASIKNYFSQVNEPIQSISIIVVSGGGSMESQYVNESGANVVTSKSISSYITDMIKDVCDGVDAVSHSDAPRLANIRGLYLRAKIDAANAAKQKAKAPVQAPVQTPVQAPVQAPVQTPVQTPAQPVMQTPVQTAVPVVTPPVEQAQSMMGDESTSNPSNIQI